MIIESRIIIKLIRVICRELARVKIDNCLISFCLYIFVLSLKAMVANGANFRCRLLKNTFSNI